MMRGLRFCCEGADINMVEPEPKEKTVMEKTEPHPKSKDASVFPAKRKIVKNMVCNCFVHCICGKCLKPKSTAVSISLPTTPSATNPNNLMGSARCSCSPPQPIYASGNYGNKTKGKFGSGK